MPDLEVTARSGDACPGSGYVTLDDWGEGGEEALNVSLVGHINLK